MHHFVINAGANTGGEAVIALEAWGGTHFANPSFGEGIEITSGLARLDGGHDFPQNRGHDATGLSHDFQFAG